MRHAVTMLKAVPALFSLLSATLLASCGTCFHDIPYNVGVKRPYVEGEVMPSANKDALYGDRELLKTLPLVDVREEFQLPRQELYRIGADYYVKAEVVFTPVYKRSHVDGILWTSPDFPVIDAKRQERATYYFRVELSCPADSKWMAAERLPVLKRPQGGPVGADILTEKQAKALKPAFVKVVKSSPNGHVYVVDGRRYNLSVAYWNARTLSPRYSWTHYAMWPITAATYLVVDLPCKIIGYTGGAVFLACGGYYWILR